MSPIAYAHSLRIGSVDFVSPDEIKVLLDIEAPDDIALNTGVAHPFPRIGSHVLLPNENGFLVARIEWITIERSQYPKRKGLQDFGVIDLPFPLRKMSLMPLGVLKEQRGSDYLVYRFSRGVDTFPVVGDPVLLPSQGQIKSIIESGENRRVKIGTSPLALNADVAVDPNRLFGRHLAVLGNTGSGKSCSVAGIIRWSIDAAREKKKEEKKFIDDLLGDVTEDAVAFGLTDFINSRFIVLDPNGEYSRAFSDMDNVRLFAVEADSERNIRQLQVPLWFWSSEEWCAFTQASSKTQRPTLIQALRSVRDGQLEVALTPSTDMRRYLRTIVTQLALRINQGDPWAGGGKSKGFKGWLNTIEEGLIENDTFTSTEKNALEDVMEAIQKVHDNNRSTGPGRDEWPQYAKPTVEELLARCKEAHYVFGGSDQEVLPIDADVPRPFTGDELLRSIQANAELMGTSDYVETMLMRVRSLLSDSRMRMITNCDEELTLEKWLDDYICPSDSLCGGITIIDLSLVPAEVIHIITAVIARITFEALQRYRRHNSGKTLPTTLVMEEAHTFIRRYGDDSRDVPYNSMCTRVFEKISREGRKFGLGLVLSSQRPSELSPTVLSQCNTFLLHRISNDRDQDLVNKLVPDNLRGLLRELPTLSSQRAILLGWAAELPIMVQMNYLEKQQQPQSDDPKYWETWTSSEGFEAKVDWKQIAGDWQKYGQTVESDDDIVDTAPQNNLEH